MKRIDIRVKKTYKQLFSALISLLNEKNFDDISVIEICDRAEIHRATFYKHFTDKHDFLNACFKMKLDELIFEKPSDDYDRSKLKDSCMRMLDQLLRYLEANRELLEKLSVDKHSFTFNAVMQESIVSFISQNLKQIKMINKPEYKIKMISAYYAGAIVSVARWWLDNAELCSKDELTDFAETMINDFVKLLFE